MLVLSREAVHISLTLAALNALKAMSADIMNAFITVPNKGKIWMLLGPELDKDEGHKKIVARALYGLKSAGAAFHSPLTDCMRQLGHESNKADSDLWMKVCIQETSNGPKK